MSTKTQALLLAVYMSMCYYIQDIRQLANALSSVKLDSDSLVTICWPKEKCSLLRDDVVFVDR